MADSSAATDFSTLIERIKTIIELPTVAMNDRGKVDVVFKLATAHDPGEPSPREFVPDGLPWEQFSSAMLGLGAATSFEELCNIVNPWRERFYVSDEFLHQRSKKRRRSSPEVHDVESKMPKLGEHTTQDAPPLPPYSYQSWASVVDRVDDMLQVFEANLTSPGGLLHPDTDNLFPKAELWEPHSAWEPKSPLASEVAAHVAGLRIPRVPCTSGPAQPDMLLYAFGSFSSIDTSFANRLQRADLLSSRTMINNASGSGKTKLLHEHLCTCWAILLTCFYDKETNPYGSEDVYYAFQMLEDQQRLGPNGSRFIPNVIPGTGTGNAQERVTAWRNIWTSNTAIADHVFTLLLLARLLIYQRFRQISTNESIDLKRAQHSWALLQVCPHISGLGDVFRELLAHLALLSLDDAVKQVSTITTMIRQQGQVPELFAFDEAQAATSSFSTCFGSSFNGDSQPPATELLDLFHRSIRPVLKPLVQTMHSVFPKARICVSGTKMSAEAINEALMSSLGKPGSMREIHELGGNNTPESVSSTLGHFFGPTFCRAIQSMGVWQDILRWLQGRHRFLSVYIQAILIVRSVEERVLRDLLNAIVSALSGHDVTVDGATGFDFLNYRSILPGALRRSIIPGIISGPQNYRPDVVRTVTDCILKFLLTAEYPDYPVEDLTLVELGIGRFDKPPSGKDKKTVQLLVNENIVLLALFHWFSHKDHTGYSPLQLHLQSAMSDTQSPTKGLVFEDLIIFLFWNWFCDAGAPLHDIFTFRSPKPSWANETARLVLISDSSNPPRVVSKDTTTGLAFQASDIPSTLRALIRDDVYTISDLAYRIRRPFLKPDTLGGPDIWFALLLSCGIRLLVSVQCKCWARSDKVHKGEEIEKLLWKLAPEGWYSGKPNDAAAAALIDLEARFPRGTLDFPEPADATAVSQDPYRDYPVKTAVLRAFVALEGTYELPGTMSKQFGCYPIVTLSKAAVGDGCLRFSSFKNAVDVALERQKKRRSKK